MSGVTLPSRKDVSSCTCSFRLVSTAGSDSLKVDDYPTMPCAVAAAFISKFNDPSILVGAGTLRKSEGEVLFFKCEHNGTSYEEGHDHPSHVAAKIALFAQDAKFKPTPVTVETKKSGWFS